MTLKVRKDNIPNHCTRISLWLLSPPFLIYHLPPNKARMTTNGGQHYHPCIFRERCGNVRVSPESTGSQDTGVVSFFYEINPPMWVFIKILP
ncbi:hypothetical protein NPIL_655851 [Nephila pilipes]|uniref:Uncharacterized protein n=1 Tax=Nephila pilipes TaxID=299642 RepID=A0A8X6I3E3_NEPPI|nr:hypothetical protein NPIL_655851 [Nephila pilipes]